MMHACLPGCVCPSSKNSWLALMDEWWKFITPAIFGVNSVKKFSFGADKFFLQNDLPYETKSFHLSACKYPPIGKAADFIKIGLEQNCPVAFLNLNSGEVPLLQPWHWMLITALSVSGRSVTADICDGGSLLQIDFSLWYKTTKHFGGFAYFSKKD